MINGLCNRSGTLCDVITLKGVWRRYLSHRLTPGWMPLMNSWGTCSTGRCHSNRVTLTLRLFTWKYMSNKNQWLQSFFFLNIQLYAQLILWTISTENCTIYTVTDAKFCNRMTAQTLHLHCSSSKWVFVKYLYHHRIALEQQTVKTVTFITFTYSIST